ncbi:MAG: hypothetical protein FJ267_05240, partial [Planctomycetes bacterium]|nr:hypothetical protein [Planctomycetota bacterium]
PEPSPPKTNSKVADSPKSKAASASKRNSDEDAALSNFLASISQPSLPTTDPEPLKRSDDTSAKTATAKAILTSEPSTKKEPKNEVTSSRTGESTHEIATLSDQLETSGDIPIRQAPQKRKTGHSIPVTEPQYPITDDSLPQTSPSQVIDGPKVTNVRRSSSTIPVVTSEKSASKPSKTSSKSAGSFQIPRWGLGVIAGSILVVLLAWYSFSGSGRTKRATNVESNTIYPDDKRVVRVGGPQSEFASINAALDSVRKRYRPSKPKDQFTISVAPGEYKERIVIDATLSSSASSKSSEPEWPSGIKIVGEGKVTLASDGNGPAIQLKGVSGFVAENLDIDGSGKPIAVEVSGDMPGSRLTRLSIRNFTSVGVSCRGVQGSAFGNSLSDEVILDQLRIESLPQNKSAVGINLAKSDEGASCYVIIRDSVFTGPLSSGVMLSNAGPYKISIVGNRFTQNQDAIQFDGLLAWKDISIVNNTIHDTNYGIRWTHMPMEGTRDLIIRRNLFVKMKSAEGFVQSGFNESAMPGIFSVEPPGAEFNWSDRGVQSAPPAGDIGFLFATNGKRDVSTIQFTSTTPSDARFLALTTDTHPKVDLSPNPSLNSPHDRPWIGAIGP